MVTAFLDFAFRPFSGKEEDTLRSKRPSLLSEVIFLQPAAVTRSEKSAAKSTDGDRWLSWRSELSLSLNNMSLRVCPTETAALDKTDYRFRAQAEVVISSKAIFERANPAGARLSKVSKVFGSMSRDIILSIFSKRRRLQAWNFAVILILFPLQHVKRSAIQE